jgi:hypothetical protein
MDVTRNRKRIGELLRDTGLINNNHLDIAIKYQNATHEKLASILFQMGAVDEKSIASLLEKQLNTKPFHQMRLKKLPLNSLKHIL